VAVDAQSIGQTPGIPPVGLVAAGDFAFAVTLGAGRRDRINGHPALQQLLDDHALAGLHGGGQARAEGGNLLAPALPAGCGMGDLKVGDDLPATIDDDDIVMILGPVEAGIVGDFIPG
jgi:hypothetical protein